MSKCVTCGDPLHPERARRYDYCLRPECRERNAKGLQIVAVGVNKAADQYIPLTERNRQEMQEGLYKKVPGAPKSKRRTKRFRPTASHAPTPSPGPRPQPKWSKAQQDLALIYRDRGMKPDEIAEKLGMSRYQVTQMLLAALSRRPR